MSLNKRSREEFEQNDLDMSDEDDFMAILEDDFEEDEEEENTQRDSVIPNPVIKQEPEFTTTQPQKRKYEKKKIDPYKNEDGEWVITERKGRRTYNYHQVDGTKFPLFDKYEQLWGIINIYAKSGEGKTVFLANGISEVLKKFKRKLFGVTVLAPGGRKPWQDLQSQYPDCVSYIEGGFVENFKRLVINQTLLYEKHKEEGKPGEIKRSVIVMEDTLGQVDFHKEAIETLNKVICAARQPELNLCVIFTLQSAKVLPPGARDGAHWSITTCPSDKVLQIFEDNGCDVPSKRIIDITRQQKYNFFAFDQTKNYLVNWSNPQFLEK